MFRRAGLLLALALFAARGAAAQETINLASLSGRVTDPQGAAVADVTVMARHVETNVRVEATTGADGRFRFAYLRVGGYEVTLRKAGFGDASRVVTLTLGSAFDLPIGLVLAGVSTQVTVAAQATVIETTRSQIAGTVPQAEVTALPMNGRNFLDLALLVPGVSPTNIASTQLFPETSAVAGQGISVGSQRNFSNNFIVDGLSANDDAAGLSGLPQGVDAVEQVQVVTSGAQAELGRALGGYINVVTRSGTNTRRGDFYEFFRDDSLNADNALSHSTLPMRQQQYGASFGGPLVADRTFYFANVEQRRLDQTGLATIAAEAVGVINARLAATAYPGLPMTTGVYPNPIDNTTALGKIDHQWSGSDQLTVRYTLYSVSSDNSRGAGGLNAPTASAGLDNTDQGIAIGNTKTLSAHTVNETRAQVTHGNLQALPTDPVGPAVSIAGVATFGTSSGSPTGRVNTLYQVVDNLSHQAGAHALRAGVDVLLNDDTITYPRSIRGAYTFSSLTNFLSGVYNTAGFTQTFGATRVVQTNPNVGVFAQDEWRAGARLTINAGLRYDLQFLETITTDTNNVSPRVGFAWTPSAAANTVVRGSAGLFYDRVPLRAVANALLSAGNTSDIANLRQIGISLSPAQAGAPAFPAVLPGVVPLVTLVNLTTMDRNIRNASSRQVSVELERHLGGARTISLAYQHSWGRNLIIQINQNVPTCVAAGTNNGCRPNPNYANNSQYSSKAWSDYSGLHVSFVQRPARWGSYRVSYALSKSMNNVGENFFSSPIDPFDLARDWGRSDDDQRHRLTVNGSVKVPFGLEASWLLQAYSALPFNITSGVTTLQGTAGRPIINGGFIERNAGAGSDFFSASARVSRGFRIVRALRAEAMVEVFNLTNRRNNLTRNTTFGAGAYPSSPAGNFAQITAVGDPRALQLGVRLHF